MTIVQESFLHLTVKNCNLDPSVQEIFLHFTQTAEIFPTRARSMFPTLPKWMLKYYQKWNSNSSYYRTYMLLSFFISYLCWTMFCCFCYWSKFFNGNGSGEYGGGKSTSTPTSWLEAIPSGMWCIEQLSNTTHRQSTPLLMGQKVCLNIIVKNITICYSFKGFYIYQSSGRYASKSWYAFPSNKKGLFTGGFSSNAIATLSILVLCIWWRWTFQYCTQKPLN